MPKREPEIIIEDPVMAAGYTMVPNLLMDQDTLSMGAKFTYAALLRYAWQEGACYPGQETLGRAISASARAVRNYLRELEAAGLVTVQQRGLNSTNLYILHRIPTPGPAKSAGPEKRAAGPAKSAGQERKKTTHQDRQNLPTTKTQTDNTQKTTVSDQENTAIHSKTVDIPSPVPTQLDDFRTMTLEERLAHFEENRARMARMKGLG